MDYKLNSTKYKSRIKTHNSNNEYDYITQFGGASPVGLTYGSTTNHIPATYYSANSVVTV